MGGFLKSRAAYWLGVGCCSYQAFAALLIFLVVVAFFGGAAGPLQESAVADEVTACGETVATLVDGISMTPTTGKLGHEEHLLGVNGTHYVGTDSEPLGDAGGGGAFSPHTPDQEHWYFNTQWGGWDWEPTRLKRAPRLDHSPGADEARSKVPHSRLIITSTETNKSIVVSAEESGPALWVTDRDGINTGAPPEVYKYLGGSTPYTGSLTDGKGAIKIGFAKDQNAKLGPCN